MKGKRINWITLWLLIASLALMVTGTYAAFTSVDYIKRVVSTRKGDAVLFNSNCLYPYSIDTIAADYKVRRVNPVPYRAPDNSDVIAGYSFSVEIFNHLFDDETVVNQREIEYRFKASLQVSEEAKRTDAINGITVTSQNGTTHRFNESGQLEIDDQVLTAGVACKLTYTFSIPQELRDLVIIEVVAEPIAQSYAAAGNQKLAAIIVMKTENATSTWSGQFIDSRQDTVGNARSPADYDGYNYEIRCSGEQYITLWWSTDLQMQISPWFAGDHGTTVQTGRLTSDSRVTFEDKNYNYCVISVEDPHAMTGYLTQFYILDEAAIDGLTWAQLDSMVGVAPGNRGQ